MIKARELMIGNWLKLNKKPKPIFVRVTAMPLSRSHSRWQIEANEEDYGFKDLDPIPLTLEILEKAGFGKATSENSDLEPDYDLAYITPFARKRLVLAFDDNGPGQINTYWIENVGMREVSLTFDIKYLHELQNLYFALFQKELPINL